MNVEDEICGGPIEVGDFGERGAGTVGHECLGGGIAGGRKLRHWLVYRNESFWRKNTGSDEADEESRLTHFQGDSFLGRII